MTGIPFALLIAVLLLSLIVLAWLRGLSAARELASAFDVVSPDDDGGQITPCPPELVLRIFSIEDWSLVSATNSTKLEKLFRRERRAVALLWVQQTSAAIRRIMREHMQVSRGASDLEFTTEVRLVVQYAQLMLICGILNVVIQLFGPLWLRGLAVYADSLFQHIVDIERTLKVAATARSLPSVRPS
jgi:hypothetical protein